MENDEKLYDHLRTIHFALIAAAFILLVACSLTPKGDLERAVDEATFAAGLNVTLTEDRVSEVASKFVPSVPADAISIHEARRSLWWRVDDVYHPLEENVFPLPRPRLWIPMDKEAFSPPDSLPNAMTIEPSKRTVRDLEGTWTFLLSGNNAFVITRLIPERGTFRWMPGRGSGAPTIHQEEITDHLAGPTKLVPLRAFKSRYASAAPFPWIALYSDILPRIITFVSLVLAPVTAVALAVSGWRSLHAGLAHFFLVLGAVVSGALFVLGWIPIRRGLGTLSPQCLSPQCPGPPMPVLVR